MSFQYLPHSVATPVTFLAENTLDRTRARVRGDTRHDTTQRDELTDKWTCGAARKQTDVGRRAHRRDPRRTRGPRDARGRRTTSDGARQRGRTHGRRTRPRTRGRLRRRYYTCTISPADASEPRPTPESTRRDGPPAATYRLQIRRDRLVTRGDRRRERRLSGTSPTAGRLSLIHISEPTRPY